MNRVIVYMTAKRSIRSMCTKFKQDSFRAEILGCIATDRHTYRRILNRTQWSNGLNRVFGFGFYRFTAPKAVRKNSKTNLFARNNKKYCHQNL